LSLSPPLQPPPQPQPRYELAYSRPPDLSLRSPVNLSAGQFQSRPEGRAPVQTVRCHEQSNRLKTMARLAQFERPRLPDSRNRLNFRPPPTEALIRRLANDQVVLSSLPPSCRTKLSSVNLLISGQLRAMN